MQKIIQKRKSSQTFYQKLWKIKIVKEIFVLMIHLLLLCKKQLIKIINL